MTFKITPEEADDIIERREALAEGWDTLPKGWTVESLKKFWGSLTGNRKHKITKCMKKMANAIDDPGAFCASLARKIGYAPSSADMTFKITAEEKALILKKRQVMSKTLVDYWKDIGAYVTGLIGFFKSKEAKEFNKYALMLDRQFKKILSERKFKVSIKTNTKGDVYSLSLKIYKEVKFPIVLSLIFEATKRGDYLIVKIEPTKGVSKEYKIYFENYTPYSMADPILELDKTLKIHKIKKKVHVKGPSKMELEDTKKGWDYI